MKKHPLNSLVLSALVAGTGVLGCVGTPGLAPQQQAPGSSAIQTAPRLLGKVTFPQDREVAATTGDVIQRATIAILDSANQTVAATITDANGAFSLDVTGAFTPTPGSYYTVEAVKGLKAGASAGSAVRMRTVLYWSGSAWNSCTGAVSVAINPATTAVSLIKATQSTVAFSELMGIVSGDVITTGNATLTAHGTKVRDMVRDLLWRDLDPINRIALVGSTYAALSERTTVAAANMGTGTYANTLSLLDGSVQLNGSLPRPKTASEATASVAGVASTAIPATDGTYLYTKPWDTPLQNSKTWTKFGTGFNGTTFGTTYDTYGETMDLNIGGAVFGGLLYQIKSGAGNSGTLWRLNLTTKATDSVTLTAPMIGRASGLPDYGSFITTDGTYFYNTAYSINNGGYNGFTMRVYDPSTRALLRQVFMDGANTPLVNTSYYTDSVFVDGVYMYALEWIASGPARMRRYRIADGQLEVETTVPQDHPSDGVLGGTFDWVNNKFYFGTHQGTVLHRTAGRTFPASGTWVSAPIDMGSAAPIFKRLNFSAVALNGQTVRLQVRSSGSEAGVTGATWYGPATTGDSYTTSGSTINPIHQGDRWVQIKATLTPGYENAATGLGTTPRLYGVNLEAIQ